MINMYDDNSDFLRARVGTEYKGTREHSGKIEILCFWICEIRVRCIHLSKLIK